MVKHVLSNQTGFLSGQNVSLAGQMTCLLPKIICKLIVTLTWSFLSLLRLRVSLFWKFAVFNTGRDIECILSNMSGEQSKPTETTEAGEKNNFMLNPFIPTIWKLILPTDDLYKPLLAIAENLLFYQDTMP